MENMKNNAEYGYYSKKLNKPFDTLSELKAAELADAKAREAKVKAAQEKKASAVEVEQAYKNLNTVKRAYKEGINSALSKYTEEMKRIQKEFTEAKAKLTATLADAEANYEKKLKEFTDKHPEGFHITLKDGDYETIISRGAKPHAKESQTASNTDWISDLFCQFFGI